MSCLTTPARGTRPARTDAGVDTAVRTLSILTTIPETLRGITTEPVTTADQWAPIVVTVLALVILLAARHYFGR